MTTPSGERPEDDFWRRPSDTPGGEAPGAAQRDPGGLGRPAAAVPPAAGGYAGPPPTTPPPPGWRPPVHLQAALPRRLPPQDMVELDVAEQRAQRITWGVGGVAAVVLALLVCLLCSRALF
ncbi:hypothetical protein ACFY2R_02245 [Micromonospora olivasterospora]|uniref:Uncharacterized protein n=1 Tax=Micromonospora olivasterospora TaxID=1880 RepID=A0A562IB66_MICOL|nr:hypothetical protein [Micromonospora olivasterospora]TWH68241.1 hypothetical protein JD77_03231 [Micromonospora olivasterospora]